MKNPAPAPTDRHQDSRRFARLSALAPENHPAPEEVHDWAQRGELHLALATADTEPNTGRDNAGVVVLNHDAPQTYREADWTTDKADDEVLVVHTLGVGPGVARYLMEAAIDVAKAEHCRIVRLGTYIENVPTRELYGRYGFTDLGVHALNYEGTDLDQFHLFESCSDSERARSLPTWLQCRARVIDGLLIIMRVVLRG